MNKNSARFLNYLLLFTLFFGVYLWSSVYRNAEANPSGFEAQVSFLDVGQGDAALINLPGSKQILIDGGRGGFVLDQIRSRMPANDKKIEYVIATHPDSDHIGGLPSVAKSYEVGEYISNGAQNSSQVYTDLKNAVENKHIAKRDATQGDTISFPPGADAQVLWPNEEGKKLSNNDGSLVLKFTYKGACALFSADAETEAQNRIMAIYSKENLSCELLKVPHHGASTALNKKFTQEVSPKYAVISVGKKNSYGHPTQAVLDALSEIKARIFRTDQEGTIDFATNGTSWTKK